MRTNELVGLAVVLRELDRLLLEAVAMELVLSRGYVRGVVAGVGMGATEVKVPLMVIIVATVGTAVMGAVAEDGGGACDPPA